MSDGIVCSLKCEAALQSKQLLKNNNLKAEMILFWYCNFASRLVLINKQKKKSLNTL